MINTKLNTPEFSILVTGFEKELIKESGSDWHRIEYTSYIREFLSYTEANGVTSIRSIAQPLITDYVLYLEQQRMNLKVGGSLEEATINKHKNAIRKFWKYLNAEGIKVNAIVLRQRKKRKQKEPTVLTLIEIEQLFSVCDDTAIGHRDRAMLALYYGCGLRKSEGLKLLLTDFDFAKGRIRIIKPKDSRKQAAKNNRERYVMMSPTVQQHIEEYIYTYRDFYLSEQSTCDALFIGERGTLIKPETIAKRIEALWQRVKDRYGNDKHIGLHTLRHSLGTHLYMAKMDIEMIALMLGHRTLEATQLYIHSANLIKQ